MGISNAFKTIFAILYFYYAHATPLLLFSIVTTIKSRKTEVEPGSKYSHRRDLNLHSRHWLAYSVVGYHWITEMSNNEYSVFPCQNAGKCTLQCSTFAGIQKLGGSVKMVCSLFHFWIQMCDSYMCLCLNGKMIIYLLITRIFNSKKNPNVTD